MGKQVDKYTEQRFPCLESREEENRDALLIQGTEKLGPQEVSRVSEDKGEWLMQESKMHK